MNIEVNSKIRLVSHNFQKFYFGEILFINIFLDEMSINWLEIKVNNKLQNLYESRYDISSLERWKQEYKMYIIKPDKYLICKKR